MNFHGRNFAHLARISSSHWREGIFTRIWRRWGRSQRLHGMQYHRRAKTINLKFALYAINVKVCQTPLPDHARGPGAPGGVAAPRLLD